MTALRVDVETKTLGAFLDAAPTKTSIALLRALKRGTKSARTHAARVVSRDMGLKVGEVRNRIRLKEPTGQTLTGELGGSLKRIPLIKLKGGRKRRPRHAFIATMPTGHEGVFKRAGSKRLPIRELFGPSVGRVFDLHRGEIMARGEEVTTAELDRLLDRIFGASSG